MKIIEINASDTELLPFLKQCRHSCAQPITCVTKSHILKIDTTNIVLQVLFFSIPPFKVSKNKFEFCSAEKPDYWLCFCLVAL